MWAFADEANAIPLRHAISIRRDHRRPVPTTALFVKCSASMLANDPHLAAHLEVVARAIRNGDQQWRSSAFGGVFFWGALVLVGVGLGLGMIGYVVYDHIILASQHFGGVHVGLTTILFPVVGCAIIYYALKWGVFGFRMDLRTLRSPPVDVDRHRIMVMLRDGVGSPRGLRGVVGAKHQVWIEMGRSDVHILPVQPHEVEPLLTYLHWRYPEAKPLKW